MIAVLLRNLVNLVSEGWSWWWDGLTENTIFRVVAALSTAAIAISWYVWLIKKASRGLPPLPPGPRGLPLLGNLLFIEPDLHRYFSKLSQLYGPIFKLQLGSKTCIVISSSSVAKEILKDHDVIFANRDVPISALALTYGGQDIAWSHYSPEWRKLRKVFVQEMMSSASLDACSALRRREVQEMVRDVYGKVGTPINMGDQMFLTVLNVVTSMLWGGTLHGEDRSRIGMEFRRVIVETVGLMGKPNISDLFPALAWFDLQGIESRAKKLVLWFDRIFESLIAQRTQLDGADGGGKNKSKESKDFLQFMLELMHQGDDKTSVSITQLKALFMDIVVAATDTSSTTVEWAMAELLQHPQTMQKAQEELEKVVGNKNIVEESHLFQLPYLGAVIKETLRLHPPLPLLVPHSPSTSCIISGYTIPKGSRILFNAWAMQRNPEVWEHPLEFIPERFLEDAASADYKGNNFNFMPFGSGRRICAGLPLAEKMLLYVLASLLHSFDWKLPDGRTSVDLEERFGIVLKKSETLLAIPTARLSN
ncbi:flavonoid 3'-monooxygenase CYP75B137 [Vitis vinifera]|uniref:Uncharacterized protein n=1 Tax=Vitis vinifera TaxID=29760 RepID=D7T245_VITVI|eukprot:XP_019081503.1 PREDICTED: 7-ethoxycoumarin O-deethylase [Vitis vinifera]